MKFRTTLALLAAAIGLGALLIFTALRLEEHPAAGGGTRIFARDAAPEELLAADGIEIVREGMILHRSLAFSTAWAGWPR